MIPRGSLLTIACLLGVFAWEGSATAEGSPWEAFLKSYRERVRATNDTTHTAPSLSLGRELAYASPSEAIRRIYAYLAATYRDPSWQPSAFDRRNRSVLDRPQFHNGTWLPSDEFVAPHESRGALERYLSSNAEDGQRTHLIGLKPDWTIGDLIAILEAGHSMKAYGTMEFLFVTADRQQAERLADMPAVEFLYPLAPQEKIRGFDDHSDSPQRRVTIFTFGKTSQGVLENLGRLSIEATQSSEGVFAAWISLEQLRLVASQPWVWRVSHESRNATLR